MCADVVRRLYHLGVRGRLDEASADSPAASLFTSVFRVSLNSALSFL